MDPYPTVTLWWVWSLGVTDVRMSVGPVSTQEYQPCDLGLKKKLDYNLIRILMNVFNS